MQQPPSLYIAKTRSTQTPEYGTEMSGGLDFFVPKFTPSFLTELAVLNENRINTQDIYIDYGAKLIIMCPGSNIMIPSGVYVNLLNINGGYVTFDATNRSSIAIKYGLNIAASLVDSDYQGEVHLSVNNSSNRLCLIHGDMKLQQFVIRPMLRPEGVKVLPFKQLFNSKTKRGEGRFGHTGESPIPIKGNPLGIM